ncbi:unnamed protein product [Effrenium voratum]|nr:unnamed protein product [Effrenium voratum]
MGRRGRGRDKKAQKQWLSDKRRGLDSAPEDKLLKAEEDFRGYYEAQELFGEPGAVQQDAFWAALRAPLPVTLRVREPCATTEEKLRSGGWKRRWEFDKAGMSVWEMDSRQYAADSEQRSWAERENRRGLLCFQELVSLVPALLLSPQAGEVCLDLCAAPGNKSLQLLEELAQNGPSEGAVLSADNDAQRCCLTLHRVLGKAASPMSCAALANAGHFPVLVEERDGDPERLPCSKVLVDVPCSGDGTARKNSQVWRSWSRREALGLQRLQRQILLRALYLLPPGGVVVYSTCSLNPVENEAVVLSTLQKWQSSLGEGRGKLPVELLDAVAICREKCGLQPAPGLCNWQVPAPQRGGPLFNQFSEVPPELLEDDRYALRPEMFASGATQVRSERGVGALKWPSRYNEVPMDASDSMEGNDSEKVPLLAEVKDAMSYDARTLVTFSVFKNCAGTVWRKPSLWKMMGCLFLIAVTVSATVAVVVKDPAKLDVQKFQKVSTFLEVVVGLLLSFFLSSSVQRWYDCTNGFLELFDAVRGLHMQLSALGVPREHIRLCLRYCCVSANCLTNELVASAMVPEDRKAFVEQCWQDLTRETITDSWGTPESGLAQLLPHEQEALAKTEDPAQALWVWITSLLTRMAADGEVPAMATPTYGRIMTIAENAFQGIRTVRASVRVQPPYVHVQMMAALVLVNNLINAVSIGMTSGVTISICLANAQIGMFAGRVKSEQVSSSLQDLAVGMVLSSVGPFLYQALLEVAVCIAQPFAVASDTAPGRIPTEKLIQHLEKDLKDIEFMSSNLPWWKQPFFKK